MSMFIGNYGDETTTGATTDAFNARMRALKRFALNLIQVWRDNAAQHIDVVRFLKVWVIQVFRKPL